MTDSRITFVSQAKLPAGPAPTTSVLERNRASSGWGLDSRSEAWLCEVAGSPSGAESLLRRVVEKELAGTERDEGSGALLVNEG